MDTISVTHIFTKYEPIPKWVKAAKLLELTWLTVVPSPLYWSKLILQKLIFSPNLKKRCARKREPKYKVVLPLPKNMFLSVNPSYTTQAHICAVFSLSFVKGFRNTVGQVILATKKVANCKKTPKSANIIWSPIFLVAKTSGAPSKNKWKKTPGCLPTPGDSGDCTTVATTLPSNNFQQITVRQETWRPKKKKNGEQITWRPNNIGGFWGFSCNWRLFWSPILLGRIVVLSHVGWEVAFFAFSGKVFVPPFSTHHVYFWVAAVVSRGANVRLS